MTSKPPVWVLWCPLPEAVNLLWQLEITSGRRWCKHASVQKTAAGSGSVTRCPRGKVLSMEPSHAEHGSPEVTAELHGDAARLTVSGELTDAARRPLVREVTDLLLGHSSLQRIDLDLREVEFVNSAGIAVLVQLHKLVGPRAIDLVLVAPPPAVVRPLQLTGLWHRFTVADGPGEVVREGTGQGTGEHS